VPIVKIHSGRDRLNAKLEIRKKSDAFLVCHGFSGSMYEPEESSVMEDLTHSGYTSMIVSHKTGRRPDLIFQEQVRQIIDAVTYLLEQIAVKRVHVFGISMGASNALSAGAADERIASVASSSGIKDCNLWLRERLGKDFEAFTSRASKYEVLRLKKNEDYIGPLFEVPKLLRIPTENDAQKVVRGRITHVSVRTVRSLLTYRPILGVPGIKNKPVFFFHGTGDELVSHRHTLEMYIAARTRKYKLLIPGGSHGMILLDSVRNKILSMYLRELHKNNLLD
jgi:fermentation-respiration switch protein FrsA (DUF1100 family)